MEDVQIIAMYNERNEDAIVETDKKYGAFCHKIASNLLQFAEDAEECVQDTYETAWTTIPPANPSSLRTFLGRIIRNCSISRFRHLNAQKRSSAMTVMLSELEDCIPATETTEEAYDRKQLAKLISDWLSSLKQKDYALFVRRYWFGESVSDLAKLTGCTAAQMAQRMLYLRRKLRAVLEKEGIDV